MCNNTDITKNWQNYQLINNYHQLRYSSPDYIVFLPNWAIDTRTLYADGRHYGNWILVFKKVFMYDTSTCYSIKGTEAPDIMDL